jgi:L-ascorbate metabolism protein UlaG (beta-lactamase superfamily)
MMAGGGSWNYATNSLYSGPTSDHFDGARFFVPGLQQESSVFGYLRWRLIDGVAAWPDTYPSPHSDEPPKRVGHNEIRVVLIGHASFLIQIAGRNILVDPVYSDRASPVGFAGPKRLNAPGITFGKLPPIDLVLVSHAHYDHLDTETLARLSQTFSMPIATPLGNDAIIRAGLGNVVSVTAHDWGETYDAGDGVQVHFVPSYHSSARGLLDQRKSLWCSFVITSPAGTIYHVADTAYGDGKFFRDVAKKFELIRLAHIPIGAYEPRTLMRDAHVNPQDAVKLLQDCGAQQAIGHHWGTFQLTGEELEQSLTDLASALQAAGIEAPRFRPFRPGQVWSGGV